MENVWLKIKKQTDAIHTINNLTLPDILFIAEFENATDLVDR
jgi:hypothetical protein